ncbi:MAG TPA: SDR family oxidoreductase [Steroidobacteraceae bacterium]
MNILLTGITGFIGRHLAHALREAGHRVIGVSRSGTGSDMVRGDFTKDLQPEVWVPRLRGIDVVINAAGILRERGTQTFDAIHTRAPQALFAACVQSDVKRVIQISALGADRGQSGYFRSKRAADDFLASLPLDWTIVQPSLVYGEGGTSARLFTMLASLPVIGVPGHGEQRVQPIHVDDVVAAVVALCERSMRRRAPLVGPQEMSFKELLLQLRAAMGLGRGRLLYVPMRFMRFAARIAEISPHSLLDRETLAMLEAGNVADPSLTAQLLGRAPRGVKRFVDRGSRENVVRAAQLGWLLPLLRIGIALVWLWTGIVSLGLYPREESYELLHRTGVPADLAPMFLYGAATLDLLLGLATLLLRRRRLLWLAQIAVILAYTAIITAELPEFWLHPYGPVLKNIPMLIALYMLYVLERPPWNTSS